MDAFSLGQLLRESREAKELTLNHAEDTLRIRRVILEAFEAGNFDQVDASPVQLRGLIRNYARYVGQDEELILQYYDSVLDGAHRNGRQVARRQSKARERTAQRRGRSGEPDTRSSQSAPVVAARPNTESARPATLSDHRRPHPVVRLARTLLLLISSVAAIGLIAFVTIQLLQRPTAASDEVQTTQIGVVGDLPSTLTLTPRASPTPLPGATLVPMAAQNYAGEPVFVTMEFRQRVWLRVMVDGVEQFAGLVRPQEAVLEYRAVNEIAVSASSAAALVVTYNGQPQSVFGARGQAIDIIFRPNDDVEISTGPGFDPTPVFSPTPQDTSIPFASTLLAEQTASPTPDPSLSVPTEDAAQAQTATPAGIATLPSVLTLTPTSLPVVGKSLTPSPLPTIDATVTAVPTEEDDGGSGDGGILPPRLTPTNVVPPK